MKTSQMLDLALLAAQHVLRPAPPEPPKVPLPQAPLQIPDGKYELRDEALFFAEVRKITGPLQQIQVDTIKGLLKAGNHWPTAKISYAFATAWWEARLKPIPEIGKGKGRKYGKPGKWYGQIPYGRGLPQITWDYNYEWADKALGLNGKLLRNFDLALEPDITTRILVLGMDTGAFTGKALRNYFTGEYGTYEQAVEARRIINGTDKAAQIAALFLRFQDAFALAGWKD